MLRSCLQRVRAHRSSPCPASACANWTRSWQSRRTDCAKLQSAAQVLSPSTSRTYGRTTLRSCKALRRPRLRLAQCQHPPAILQHRYSATTLRSRRLRRPAPLLPTRRLPALVSSHQTTSLLLSRSHGRLRRCLTILGTTLHLTSLFPPRILLRRLTPPPFRRINLNRLRTRESLRSFSSSTCLSGNPLRSRLIRSTLLRQARICSMRKLCSICPNILRMPGHRHRAMFL